MSQKQILTNMTWGENIVLGAALRFDKIVALRGFFWKRCELHWKIL